jgi:alkylation response protein AidB-like acyl-CoA dehydrogenase
MKVTSGDEEIGQTEYLQRVVGRLLADHDPTTLSPEEFFGAQFDHGLARVDWPVGRGGLGLPPRLQREVDEQLRRAGAKSAVMRNPLGVGMGLPTLQQHGTPAQLDRFARRCFTTEDIWCQLFSEPGSGSDLAGLSTRAAGDGGHWVVDGQKLWTSLGHVASVGMLLARTDPHAPKHRGLTFFLLDMHSPGVEVRPVKDMTGDSRFNEVFLTGVRVPDSCRVGEPGAGWSIAMTTLQNERVVLSGEGSGPNNVGGGRVESLIDRARSEGQWSDPIVRQELMRRLATSRAIRSTNVRSAAARRAGQSGTSGSVTKVMQGLYNQSLQKLAVDLHGAGGVAWDDEDAGRCTTQSGFLRSQSNTIAGGTSNILRSTIAERTLGLPKEPGFPSSTPWCDLPRNG